ncbi:unnamed protein product [Microthlaspi erraticum]|uniref:Uncharacterized protein n=1 Tax=Microthlaspi erraticum TaxID=1685480 RepID=A0A6D2IZ13_9BRAS|nr:unnamed protein product [Microthlaspi erraticum]
MSRKGVITKRVKTVQTALSRISAQRAVRLAEERTFRARPNLVRPSEVSAKVQNHRPHAITTRETKPAVGQRHSHRARPAREPGSKPRGRATVCVPADAPSEPGNARVRPRDFIGQSSSVRPQRPTTHPSATTTDRPTRPRPDVRPIVPTDRPNAAVDPKPVLKPDFIFSSPA